jgi:hypothetical protein
MKTDDDSVVIMLGAQLTLEPTKKKSSETPIYL